MNMLVPKVNMSGKVMVRKSDCDFLEDATKVVLNHIANKSFTLDQLLTELKISRAHFYRKIYLLTGQNPSGFIRTIRLKYAAHLLEQQDFPIGKISVLSGFKSLSYFCKTFRKLFGQTPQQYQQKNRRDFPIEVLFSNMEKLIIEKADNRTSH